MIYMGLCVIFFIGILVGSRIQAWIYARRVEMGKLVYCSDGKWIGLPAAFLDIAKKNKQKPPL